ARIRKHRLVYPLAEDEKHGKNRKADFWRCICSHELHSTSIGGAQEQAIHSSEWICCRRPPRKRRPRPDITFGLRSRSAVARWLDVAKNLGRVAGEQLVTYLRDVRHRDRRSSEKEKAAETTISTAK